jgi:uncharacterized protein (DUF2345 family)
VGKNQIQIRDLANNNQVLIDARANTVTVAGKTKCVVKDSSGANRVEVKAAGTVEVAATGKISLEASTISINARAQLEIKAGGVVTLNGALVKIN